MLKLEAVVGCDSDVVVVAEYYVLEENLLNR
jgi:hypothetical protein